jgi:hypothetical protein
MKTLDNGFCVRFCGTDSGTSWFRKVIKFGGFLTTLGVRLRVLRWQVEGWVKPQEVSSPIWDGDGLFVYSTCPPTWHITVTTPPSSECILFTVYVVKSIPHSCLRFHYTPNSPSTEEHKWSPVETKFLCLLWIDEEKAMKPYIWVSV